MVRNSAWLLLALGCLIASRAQAEGYPSRPDLLSISSPAAGFPVKPGDVLKVHVDVMPVCQYFAVRVTGDDLEMSPMKRKPPFDFELHISPILKGQKNVRALVLLNSGETVSSDPVPIDIEPLQTAAPKIDRPPLPAEEPPAQTSEPKSANYRLSLDMEWSSTHPVVGMPLSGVVHVLNSGPDASRKDKLEGSFSFESEVPDSSSGLEAMTSKISGSQDPCDLSWDGVRQLDVECPIQELGSSQSADVTFEWTPRAAGTLTLKLQSIRQSTMEEGALENEIQIFAGKN